MCNKVLALIPARAGSKRVAGKNIRSLGGMPLVEHTIRVAVESSCFSSIVLSSDSSAVLALADRYDAVTAMPRFAKNGTDISTILDVVDEVWTRLADFGLEQPDSVMILQPTTPFRRIGTIVDALDLHRQHAGDSVISVSPAATHPYWCKSISGEGILSDFLPDFKESKQSQDLPSVYGLNGSIYLCSFDNLRKSRSLYSRNTRALLVNSAIESLDIDTEDDWLIAEAVYSHLKRSK